MNSSYVRRITLITMATLLASCSTPFSDRLANIDWAGPPAVGTIAVSDPKMYRRESLINERRREVKWLDDQLNKVDTVEFKPEIVREVQQITAFAAALGLNFDPTSALTYRRASETGAIQQQIDVLKIQLQLDQLKRDAELVRNSFGTQTASVNTDLAKLGNVTATPASSTIAAGATTQLNAAIERLLAGISQVQGGADNAIPRSDTSVNPSDLFRDKMAYRDLIKSALNAANLDDLHDHAGRTLMRLNFQAMVLPDREHSRVPGVVQMKIVPPVLDIGERETVYRNWLAHINLHVNRGTPTGWEPNPELLNSSAADSFELVNYYYPIPARATKGATPVCTGIVLKDIPAPVGCGRLVFAVPRYAGHTVQEGPYASLSSYMSQFNLSDLSDKHESKRFEGARERIRTLTASLVKNCGLPQLAYSTDPKPTPAKELENDISEAHKRAAMADDLARIERAANLILREKDLQPASATEQSRVLGLRAARARFLLRSFEDEAYRGCRADQRQAYRDSLHLLFLPSNFEEILSERGLIAVFEVGPREQVQQVSSVSRVANNLSMALSLAASAPSAGVGASAAANYSREAIGRAATLERVPALIGYAAADDIFGWVVTPKAMFDPKGSVRLEQSPRTLDLTADLSVPSWWPRFAIEITTGWAAGAQPITHGNIALPVHRTATVQMAANYADFDELTARIQHGAATREVVLDEVVLKGQFVAKCRPTNLYLRGPNIWRTTAVVLGGYQLDESAITVAPDMSGILLAVPALDEHIVGPSRADLPLTVFTRHGHKEGFVEYRAVQDGCKPPEKPDDPNKPVITSVVPTAFKAGTLVFFTITSSNLEKFKKVTLNGAPGTLLESIDGGKSIRARFEVANTNIAASRAVQLVFYDDKKEIGEWKVESTK